jgi:ATP-dependent DNA helicase PIF1
MLTQPSYPHRTSVENANRKKMQLLQGASYIFNAHDSGEIEDKVQRDKLLSNCMAPLEIELKVGCQVMLIKNIDDGLVNGSLGKVVGFMNEQNFDLYHKNDEEVYQAPDSTDASAASRLEQFKRPDTAAAKTNTVTDTMARKWPLVRFALADGTSRDLLCQPETWKIELPNGKVQAQRQQIPLILAWALSIHKAQGQTLERVKINLGGVFEKGQAYVALSRATCKEGLQVSNFDPRKVMAHPRVISFYDGLYDVMNIAKKKPVQQKVLPQPQKVQPQLKAPSRWEDENEELLQMFA